MAELSVDEAQRLVRQFLTGTAGPAEIGRLGAALGEDQAVALELLAQMQSALDDVAPSALSAEQDRSVDSRIEALIVPRIKKRGLFGWLKKLFRRRPSKPKASRRKGSAPTPPAPPVDALAELPPPSTAPAEDDGLEDMAPIAPGAEAPAPLAAPASAAKTAPPARPASSVPWLPLLGALLLLALLGLGAYFGWAWWSKRPHAPAQPLPPPISAHPSPAPTAAPTPRKPDKPVRGRSIGQQEDEVLPAVLPPTTPQAAGSLPVD